MRHVLISSLAALCAGVSGCTGTFTTVARTEHVVHEERLDPANLPAQTNPDKTEIVVERKDGVRQIWPRGATAMRLQDGFSVRSDGGIDPYTNDEVSAVVLRHWQEVEVHDRVVTSSSTDDAMTIALIVVGVVAFGLVVSAADASLDGAGDGIGRLGGWGLGNIGIGAY